MQKCETAVFGGGCFWCTEAVFQRLKGVQSVIPGYAGGKMENPSYYDVNEGTTGHAEVVKIEFDPSVISYKQLLDVFWVIHDPRSLNRQGADVGTQYRSVIFYTTEKQKELAEQSKKRLSNSGNPTQPVVTEIKPFDKFYDAESYHKNYYEKSPDQPYCQLIISPKINKLISQFSSLIKK